ncbi:DUF2491 family protein [Paraburkholderia sp. A3RO-2L]|uniref:DUF2491 family protein n=1 Tax=Paraburkholderia sp. A3RO-2L TaxID=3028376 RepID=UPI0032F5B8FE|nr:DUF2491 family protein [Burkholderia vietnamiensis]
MGLFNLATRVFDHKLDEAARAHAGTLPRLDNDLPLGARVGGLLTLPRADFALLDNTLLKVPGDSQLPIVGIGRLRFDADASLAVYRLYTNLGDTLTGQGTAFLQVLCRAGNPNDILDAAYYEHLARQFPESEEEQAAFQGNGFGLGELTFWVGDDLIADAGLSAEKAAALLETGEDGALRYTRDGGSGDYVRPFTAKETRIHDAYGDKGAKLSSSFMLYQRELPGAKLERLLISFDVVESQDGRTHQAAYVNYLVGLQLDPVRIKAI